MSWACQYKYNSAKTLVSNQVETEIDMVKFMWDLFLAFLLILYFFVVVPKLEGPYFTVIFWKIFSKRFSPNENNFRFWFFGEVLSGMAIVIIC